MCRSAHVCAENYTLRRRSKAGAPIGIYIYITAAAPKCRMIKRDEKEKQKTRNKREEGKEQTHVVSGAIFVLAIPPPPTTYYYSSSEERPRVSPPGLSYTYLDHCFAYTHMHALVQNRAHKHAHVEAAAHTLARAQDAGRPPVQETFKTAQLTLRFSCPRRNFGIWQVTAPRTPMMESRR